MLNYCYLDKHKILHCVNSPKIAMDNSVDGRIMQVEITAQGGFPTVGGQQIYAYSPTTVYVGGNNSTGVRLSDSNAAIQHSVNSFLDKVSTLWE